jgi:pimeloyl-ACP methyl ester carboxylesterase
LTVSLSRARIFFAALVVAICAAFAAASLAPTVAPAGAADAQASLTKQQKAAKAKAKAKRLRTGPAGLKFYTAPARRIPNQNGKLIWARKAGGLVPLKDAASTQLVLYSSRSVTGKKIAVSGSVSIPKGKAPRGGWPVITYGHGTTGIADQCAPSRNATNGPATDYISYTDDILNSWLRAGYAVVRSDYEGLGTPGTHPFLVGQASGRSMLDIVRAAHDLNPRISKKFVITGHSQGGHAALFAAGLAASWTPDLSLKGTVSYAPASQLKEQVNLLNTEPAQGLTPLAALIVQGISSVYPSVDSSSLVSDTVLPLYPQTLTKCLAQLAQPDSLGGIGAKDLLRPGADVSSLLSALDEQNPVVQSSAPIVLVQGTADTTTLPFLTGNLNSLLNKQPGTNSTYLTYPGVDHGSILDASQAEVEPIIEGWLPGGK